MRKLFVLVVSLMFCAPLAADNHFKEGVNFVTLKTEAPTSGKIRVVEFFGYFCPHCYSFEPHLKNWLKNKPEDVEFVQIPATFKRDSILMQAKTFFALEQMELIESLHGEIFDAMHNKRMRLNTQAAMENFLKMKGVDIGAYRAMMESIVVDMKLKQAIRLAERYGVSGVPTVVVDDHYRVEEAADWDEKLQITDHLIEKARANRPASVTTTEAPATTTGG